MMEKPKEFKRIPDADEIDFLDREFKFFPSSVENPQALTPEQVGAFNRDGFIKGIKVFDEEEALENRSYFDKLLKIALEAGQDSYSISTAHLRHAKVYDLLTHPQIVGYVKDLLGNDVIGWGSHFFCKMPFDPKATPWHQDASYWPLTPTKTVTVWLAIDDADVENSCMRFIKGSHLHGHLPFKRIDDMSTVVLDQIVEDALNYGQMVDVELKAGEVSIHSDLLLHGSEKNESDRRRCGLTLRYCASEVRAGLDWNEKGILISGEDPEGHWANSPRPNQD